MRPNLEETGRTVPPAGSIRRPWLWQVFAAAFVALAAALIAHFIFKPDLELSSPTLSFQDDICRAAFHAKNNTDQSASGRLRVIIGVGTPGGDANPPKYRELARKELSLSLAAGESKELYCDFPFSARSRPNTGRIEIASFDTQSP